MKDHRSTYSCRGWVIDSSWEMSPADWGRRNLEAMKCSKAPPFSQSMFVSCHMPTWTSGQIFGDFSTRVSRSALFPNNLSENINLINSIDLNLLWFGWIYYDLVLLWTLPFQSLSFLSSVPFSSTGKNETRIRSLHPTCLYPLEFQQSLSSFRYSRSPGHTVTFGLFGVEDS